MTQGGPRRKDVHVIPTWWPPKVGARLRHATHHGAGAGRLKPVRAALHVLSVFKDKDGEKRVVTAEWFPTKRRWNYTIMSVYDAEAGLIWLDGTERPL